MTTTTKWIIAIAVIVLIVIPVGLFIYATVEAKKIKNKTGSQFYNIPSPNTTPTLPQ